MKITRMKKGNWSKIRAFFDVETEEGFTIKGFKLIEGIAGLFVSFPSEKKDGEYYDTVWADKELKDKLNHLAHNEYNDTSSNDEMLDVPLEKITEVAREIKDMPIENTEKEDIPF